MQVDDTSLQVAIERRRADRLSTLAQVSRAVASILDLDRLFDEVATIIQQQFGYPFVHLYTVDPVRQQITYHAGSGRRSQAFRERGLTYDLNDPTGIIPWVGRHGQTVLANDVTLDPRYRAADLPATVELGPAETRAELTVPLVFGNNVLGVLDVQSDRRDAFSDDDRFLFEALADSVAIAIRNANLYRSERWRRQVADSLREVAGLLSTDVLLEEVLDSVLVELERTLPCDLAAIWLLQDDARGDAREHSLHVAAIRGPDVYAYTSDTPPPTHIQPDARTWVGESLNADQPTIRSLHSPPDPLGEALEFPPDHSAIAAPLRVGEQRLGLLTLAHRDPGRYGAESRAVMATFASYAAVAIENARLYQESQEQALISTVMLQVAEASQSLAALDQVLETVVQLASQLVSADRCAIMLWDDTIAAFAPAAAYGFAPTEQSTFEQSLIHLGDLPEFDQLFATGAPTVLYAVDSNPRLNKTLIANTGFESLLLIPLLSQGIVLGAMLVDCENALLTSNTSEMFLDERLIILQGIAHQTAAAVENTRLREAQQAEAYVSAALLQVSQAVSSSTDLDDTLSAIVRITPILVGVEYCLLYLWDETRTAFWLAQSYGLSQEQEAVLSGQIYEPGNFGLLDDVRERNSLATHLFAGMEGEREMLPLDLSRTLEMEQKTPRPLLAVPLSVQGQVLGAMLTVMPRTEIRAGSNTQENTRENTREKQLEIITGIAQQAAMAVQNERLQQERVGREQLERELELAREIQQIFIPRTLPHLQGWELGAIWYAARQVAGDFYDLIELPDQRLGVIVADVADKGMPAALFMALTRTLVRATALEEISPAAVLGRVNDLLVPDAQHGMFVTAAYAVLSLKTGKVTYANAGHCLPLRVSASGKVERLPKGDMALGVVAGIQPAEHNTTLEIGDSLVLYTDGVTETFSPAGDLFGEERLQDVLDSARNRPAQAILEAILTSVHVFSDNAPASDDLTLVVLRRTTES